MIVEAIILAQVLCLFLASAVIVDHGSILVVGSINADVIVPLDAFPSLGETIVASDTVDCGKTIAGGKGANQAVSCKRLGASTSFVCQFGDDANAEMLRKVLQDDGIDTSLCGKVSRPSGMGLVFLQSNGAVSAVVLGGANTAWPQQIDTSNIFGPDKKIACVLLQMEVPQYVNDQISVAAMKAGIPVFQDVGGAEREISNEHLSRCTYLSPNLSELQRLTKMEVNTDENILSAAKFLQLRGARNVLVTLGSKGSLLLTVEGEVIKQECLPVDLVVDETGAGDNFRAAFAVAHFVERKSVREAMAFGAAAGAVCVTRMGAIPSCPTRAECDAQLDKHKDLLLHLRGGGLGLGGVGGPPIGTSKSKSALSSGGKENPLGRSPVPRHQGDAEKEREYKEKSVEDNEEEETCPFKFASRINSMKDRQDLWSGERSLRGWIERQGRIKGLDLIDFNYPQHITSPRVTESERREIETAMKRAGLRCGAVCLRYPKDMQLGAMTHPDEKTRRRAIDMTKEACEWATSLGANEVVVWSAFDGYDYSLQVDYDTMWDNVVTAFQEVCDAYPTVKVSLEYKPTDENTRFFAVPSAGAALLLAQEVDRENFGLTIDFGHCLMAGENPAQSIAMVNRARKGKMRAVGSKLFGVQLGDGYGRLGAEDGLAFGSIHPTAALEFVLWLIKTNYTGHIYFDTFPRNEDPVRECEFNIRQFKKMYSLAKKILRDGGFQESLKKHDAMSVLELLEKLK